MNLTPKRKDAKKDIAADGLLIIETPAVEHQELGVFASWREIPSGR